ncbi:hypothetical protein BURMUCGD2_1858 [Burkholderia multivorans CGD2]|uniref:Uncharacterized protein n=1 Tax=Burkholderia multivorans CGD2 TaxID=513052 RepID=B9BLY9_9BURK|nr:hypothetical protein BURMUCGD2_1858 [Burkholderia multivorans CGD2]
MRWLHPPKTATTDRAGVRSTRKGLNRKESLADELSRRTRID